MEDKTSRFYMWNVVVESNWQTFSLSIDTNIFFSLALSQSTLIYIFFAGSLNRRSKHILFSLPLSLNDDEKSASHHPCLCCLLISD